VVGIIKATASPVIIGYRKEQHFQPIGNKELQRGGVKQILIGRRTRKAIEKHPAEIGSWRYCQHSLPYIKKRELVNTSVVCLETLNAH
jgi:hypothetical protein